MESDLSIIEGKGKKSSSRGGRYSPSINSPHGWVHNFPLIHPQKVVLSVRAEHFSTAVLSSQVHVCLLFHHDARPGCIMLHLVFEG